MNNYIDDGEGDTVTAPSHRPLFLVSIDAHKKRKESQSIERHLREIDVCNDRRREIKDGK
jgi:hypothetical protein